MIPFMNPDEIELLKKYFSRATNYFEFGCGGSTVLASQYQNIKSITSVESNIEWVDKVKGLLKPLEVSNGSSDQLFNDRFSYYYIDINANPKDWGRPKDKSKIENWHKYPEAILMTPILPDLILVDGRFRVACCLCSYKVMKEESFMLVHDYKIRKEYHIIENFFEIVETSDTLYVFRKKSNIDTNKLDKLLKQYVLVFA